MADNEHFELLMRDVDAWNRWRADNPSRRRFIAQIAGVHLKSSENGQKEIIIALFGAALLFSA